MNADMILHYTQQAILMSLVMCLPAIVVSATIGLLVSLIQALTQVQEQTFSFAVKLIAVVLSLFMTAKWLGGEMIQFATIIFDSFPYLSK
jgi:type III secretion protein S